MTKDLSGMTAIVTGAGAGPEAAPSIGDAIARLLGRAGATVAILDIDEKAAGKTAALMKEDGAHGIPVHADVTDEEACRNAVAKIMSDCGRLDILINNVAIGQGTSPTRIVEADWDRAMSVNVKSVLFMCKHAIPEMSAGGSIVNLSTTAIETPSASTAYGATKAAVEAITYEVAMQHGPDGIRCNNVRPGEVWSAMIERGCPTPEAAEAKREQRKARTALLADSSAWDVAEAVLFLASPAARFITGQTIAVDGGAALLRPDPNWRQDRCYWKADNYK